MLQGAGKEWGDPHNWLLVLLPSLIENSPRSAVEGVINVVECNRTFSVHTHIGGEPRQDWKSILAATQRLAFLSAVLSCSRVLLCR